MKKLFAILLLLAAGPLSAQTLNFSVSSVTTGGPTITPRLTWSTTPAATTCTASGGSAGWAGVKGPSGVQTLTPISQSETYTLVCSWPSTTASIPIRWVNPTHNDNGTPATDDGEPYTDPRGSLIAYGTSATAMAQSQMVDSPTATTATITGVTAGTLYFICVRAVNTSDRQSNCSAPPLQKTATATAGQTINRTAGLVFVKPNAPTGLQ